MSNGIYRADQFAGHAGYVAGLVHGYGIKITDESGWQWADGHAGTAVDAGVPANVEVNSPIGAHNYIFLYSESGLK